MSDAFPPSPEFPDRLLDQVLGDPEACQALRDYARRQQIETPLEDMTREELRLLAGALVAEAREHQDRSPPPNADLDLEAQLSIPADLVQQVFEDPRAQPLLTDMALANGWQMPPADLPDHVKRAFVHLLIEQGILTFEDPTAGPGGTAG